MATHEAWDRKRAAQLGQVTRIAKAIEAFDAESLNIGILHSMRTQLEAHHVSHDAAIDQMLEYDDVDTEKVDEDAERFRIAFCNALGALEDKIDSMKLDKSKSSSSQDDEFQAVELQFDEFQNFVRDYDADSTSIQNLQTRLIDLKPLNAQYQLVWKKLYAASDNDRKSQLVEGRNSFAKAFYDNVGWFTAEIDRRSPPRNPQIPVVSPTTTPSFKLPPLELKKFDGAPDAWVAFRDSFNSTVNEQPISGSTKFRYLKASIIDKNSPINHLLETDDGYDDAWKAVMDFYDDKRRIIDSHFSEMLTAKRMSVESHDEIQRLLNQYSHHVQALGRMHTEQELFRSIVAHLVIHRLDLHTRDLWETHNKNKIPLWPDLEKFLKDRRKTLSSMPVPRAATKPAVNSKAPVSQGKQMWKANHHAASNASNDSPNASDAASTAPAARKCWMCAGNHRLNQCTNFINLSIPQRLAKVTEWKICTNCFGSHAVDSCKSPFTCRQCQQKHHTMLHQESSAGAAHSLQTAIPAQQSMCNSMMIPGKSIALFQTAIVKIQDRVGEWHEVRAFLDSGSDANYISKHIAESLKLKLVPAHVIANGLGGAPAAVIKHTMQAFIGNGDATLEHQVNFLVTSKVTNSMPASRVDRETLRIPKNLVLADPTFDQPGKIDMLIGNELYGKLMCDGRLELPSGQILMNSMFGWVFTGSAPGAHVVQTETQCHLATLTDLNQTLQRFYKLEDYRTDRRFFTDEETFCEEFFQQTFKRLSTGRFLLQLPFKKNLEQLANNFRTALCLFFATEKRLQKNPALLAKYVEFMEEYESLGHMTEVDISKEASDAQAYYLPHHAVENLDSSTTSLRVVFNGSSKTSSGLSLNDTQCVGPQIQTDIFTLSIRFRQHAIVIKADIAKMYRQILVVKEQRKFQRIIWRSSPDKPLKVYEMNTLTYGTKPPSYESTRCLEQLGIDNKETFPEAAHEVRTSFYVDDLMTGASDVPKAIALASDVDKIISSAEMHLRKYNSNSVEFLKSIPEEDRESPKENTSIKALGIKWDPKTDTIAFNVSAISLDKITRRSILSEIAKIFDPQGLLGPVIFSFKLFIKDVTLLSIPWDTPLPEKQAEAWKDIACSFTVLNEIEISRHFFVSNHDNIQLHGFCDASNIGYGAAIYVRSTNSLGDCESHLVCSKSRIAPTEYRSTARLELCGAVVLAVLMVSVTKALTVHVDSKICWTDSAIVLNWLNKCPSQLQTFVANRVSEIQELSSDATWKHISGTLNPADKLSRGLKPQEIINNSFWFHGPDFLALPEDEWPESILEIDPKDSSYESEFKKVEVLAAQTSDENSLHQMIIESSLLWVLKKKFAPIMRFIFNCRAKKLNLPYRIGCMQVADLIDAEIAMIRIMQKSHFPEDFNRLSQGKLSPRNSSIKNLQPQWDKQHKIIRVGGRLNNAGIITEHQKHPMILPNCHLTRLIIREVHFKNFHVGQKATLGILRLKYWPIRASSIIRHELHKCITCFRAHPKLIQQFMGSLPSKRITPAPPFYHTGVDYCGPFDIKLSSVRSAKTTKAYVSLFVCLVTKAIHLEIVSDLTTQAFLAAFDRFASTRGLPHSMHSDNGLNFVGARNVLQDLFNFLSQSSTQKEFQNYFNQQEIEWHFIPPRAPEHGGLWEAGVKSMKYHLHRVAETSNLNFEEFATLTKKIEAILNSRPLTAISDDPNDDSFLTAGHFLIGRPLIAKADRNIVDIPMTRLQRWDRLVQMQQHFWQRWSQDYLHQLQVRTKNYKDEIPVAIGQLVLLHIDNAPTMHWPIGRITAIYPGKDGITRVASIRTPKSTYERPVTKIAILPINPTDDQPVAREDVNA